MILFRQISRMSQLGVLDFFSAILPFHPHSKDKWTVVVQVIGKGNRRAGSEVLIQNKVINRIGRGFRDKLKQMADYGEALTQASTVNHDLDGKCTILLRLSLAHLIPRCYSYWE